MLHKTKTNLEVSILNLLVSNRDFVFGEYGDLFCEASRLCLFNLERKELMQHAVRYCFPDYAYVMSSMCSWGKKKSLRYCLSLNLMDPRERIILLWHLLYTCTCNNDICQCERGKVEEIKRSQLFWWQGKPQRRWQWLRDLIN